MALTQHTELEEMREEGREGGRNTGRVKEQNKNKNKKADQATCLIVFEKKKKKNIFSALFATYRYLNFVPESSDVL